jgi:DoxX-like family
MKRTNIFYWVTTIIIFLFEGLMPALTSQTEIAREGIRHLSYPAYFGNMLVVFKVLGAFVLLIPSFSKRVKEWAYAGFGIEFIAALVSHASVDGLHFQTFLPLVFFVILSASYVCYHRRLINMQPGLKRNARSILPSIA